MKSTRKTGFLMIVPGAILLITMIVPFIFVDLIPREGLPFTYTWAAILGLFFFSAGLSLLWITGGIRPQKDDGQDAK